MSPAWVCTNCGIWRAPGMKIPIDHEYRCPLLRETTEKARPHDMVNEPPHYRGVSIKGTEVEAIDVIEALSLGYRLGTCLKYLWRAGKKGSRVEDLKKARWFLDREIAASESKE